MAGYSGWLNFQLSFHLSAVPRADRIPRANRSPRAQTNSDRASVLPLRPLFRSEALEGLPGQRASTMPARARVQPDDRAARGGPRRRPQRPERSRAPAPSTAVRGGRTGQKRTGKLRTVRPPRGLARQRTGKARVASTPRARYRAFGTPPRRPGMSDNSRGARGLRVPRAGQAAGGRNRIIFLSPCNSYQASFEQRLKADAQTFVSTEEKRFHGTHRNAEDFCDLAIIKFLVLVEYHHGALIFGQSLDGVADEPYPVRLNEQLFDRRLRVHDGEELGFPIGTFAAARRADLLAVADGVQRQVRGDPIKPGGEPRVRPVPGARLVHAEERLLRQVFCQGGIPEHSTEIAHQRHAVATQQLFKGGAVAGSDPQHEVQVLVHGYRRHILYNTRQVK